MGDMCLGDFTQNCKQVPAKSLGVSPHYCFTDGMKFPQREGDLIYKNATCLCYSLNNNNNNVHLSCAHQRPERSHDTY